MCGNMDTPPNWTKRSAGNLPPLEEGCVGTGAVSSGAVNSGGGHDPDAAVGGAVSAV